MKYYQVIKVVEAKNIKAAIKESIKAEITSVQEVTPQGSSSQELTPAIGFIND